MLRKPFFLVAVIILIAGGYVYASEKNLLPESLPRLSLPSSSSEEKTAGVTPPQLDTLQAQVTHQAGILSDQVSIFSQRAQELGTHAKNVLGSSIQVDESTPPVHERAIEYTQYLYCKQVVESYEKLHQ